MDRRHFVSIVVLSIVVLGAAGLAVARPAQASVIKAGNFVALRCLGHIRGPNYPNYLDGRTRDGSVGLAPKTVPPFTGTKWKVFAGGGASIALQCLGHIDGPRWLDGRTHDGTVGLAPTAKRPYTGTRWEVVEFDDGTVALKCLGDLEGPRWLDGRTGDGTVGLASSTEPPFTGTRWDAKIYPQRID